MPMKRVELTPGQREELDKARRGEPAQIILCYSRCMNCGRRTPHEVCHDCWGKLSQHKRMVREWSRANDEPEVCDKSDAECGAG